MLSKQKTKGLFNNQYIRSAKEKVAVVESNSTMTARVRFTSIRINNNKYFRIKLPANNPLKKQYIKLNLNTLPRANYKDGSQEMYRMVNGLCQYCGHDEFEGKITFSKKGYTLTDIYCTKCGSKQPWNYVHIFTKENQKNRGKDYAERKKSSNRNNSKINHNKKIINDPNTI